MDIFDVLLSHNADFSISVKHDGSRAVLLIAFQTESSQYSDPIPPIEVFVDKGEAVDAAAVQAAIKEAMEETLIAVTPLAEQISAAVSKTTKTSAKQAAKKPAAKKDDAECIKLTGKATELVTAKSKDKDAISKALKPMIEFNKRDKLEVSDKEKQLFDKRYKELNEHYDSLVSEEGLF